MKHQALFSSKDKSKKNNKKTNNVEQSSPAIFVGALRINTFVG